jgi:hypothetical protein
MNGHYVCHERSVWSRMKDEGDVDGARSGRTVVVVVWRNSGKSSMHDLSRWLCGVCLPSLSPFDNRHDHAAQGYQPRDRS